MILVAGVGSRLRPLTEEQPKALLEVGGESLLSRAVRLLERHGVRRLVLATGHREDRVKLALANSGLEVHFCYNEAYERTQNAVSLALCRRALGDTAFFKLDGDVFFEPEVLQRLDSSPGSLAVAVDSSRQADAEAMKVRTSEEGGIVAFGKALSSAESTGETLGIERISQGEVGGGAVARNGYGLSFELIRLLDAFVDVKFEGQRVDHACDHDDVGPAQATLNRAGSRHLSKSYVLGDQALHRGAPAFDKNELRVKTVFAEESTLMSDPQRRHVA